MICVFFVGYDVCLNDIFDWFIKTIKDSLFLIIYVSTVIYAYRLQIWLLEIND